MEVLEIGLILMGLMFLFLGAGLWVALSLFAVGVIGLEFFTSAQTGPIIAPRICLPAWHLG